MASANLDTKYYYVRHSIIALEEDAINEFKGHTNLDIEEIPAHAYIKDKRSRQPISKTLNGFLNTGLGGTVYCGIMDNGEVKGIGLTQYKKDHIEACLRRLMSRYDPPVEPHRYHLNFRPIVEPNSPDDYIAKIINYDSSKEVDESLRTRTHVISPHYCWCDQDAVARMNASTYPAEYVIEITMKPWNPDHPQNKYAVGKMRAPPVHEDETGTVYFRRHGSVCPHTPQDVYAMYKQRVQEHYVTRINSLRSHLRELRKQKKKEQT